MIARALDVNTFEICSNSLGFEYSKFFKAVKISMVTFK